MAATVNEQYMQALAQANVIRCWRAELKKDIRRGRTPAVGVLESPPRQAQTMRVLDLLLAMPKVGRVKANRMLRSAGVSPSATLGGLSERQRAGLLALVRARL